MPELQSAAPRTPSRSMKANLLKNIQFLLVLKVAQIGGGWALGGRGLTDRVIAVGLEFPAPCGCGPWAAGCGAAAKNHLSGDRKERSPASPRYQLQGGLEMRSWLANVESPKFSLGDDRDETIVSGTQGS